MRSPGVSGAPYSSACRAVRRVAYAILVAAAVGAGGAQAQTEGARAAVPAPSEALARYVAKPDQTYSWQVHARYRAKGAEVIELHVESQTWQGVLWKHQLVLIRPSRVSAPEQALLIVGGGRWRDSYDSPPADDAALPEDGELLVGLARLLHTTVAVLGQVPFQPLFGLTEDKLIAHSFDEYLKTGDPEWPLLLPMVKATVRAMDATDAAARAEWGGGITKFTVFGGSKRGWTTWLTAAVEPRVIALAPAVIDVLNMQRHFPHQTDVFGAPSEEIRPYTDLNLPQILSGEEGGALRQIVDPWSYRSAITQPKLIVVATNDAYFPLDSANLYWDDLRGPKYLLYVPNEPHGIDHYGPVFRGLRALEDAARGGRPLPRLHWEYIYGESGARLCVRSEPAPRTVKLWSAASADRDFRDARWSSGEPKKGRYTVAFEIPRPEHGYAATFAEVGFGRGLGAFVLSTNLAVLAAPDLEWPGPRPRGEPDVCEAVSP